MKRATVKAVLAPGAMLALMAGYEAYSKNVKVRRKTPGINTGFNCGLDRYIVKRKDVEVDGKNEVCAWLTRDTNVNAAGATVRSEVLVLINEIDGFDGSLPIAYEGKKKPTTLAF